MWFWRVLETGWNFDVFWDLPLGPQDSENMECEGDQVLPWGPEARLNQRYQSHLDWSFRLQAQDCKLTNSYLEDSTIPDCNSQDCNSRYS